MKSTQAQALFFLVVRERVPNDPAVAVAWPFIVDAIGARFLGPGNFSTVINSLRRGVGIGYGEISFEVDGEDVEVYYVDQAVHVPRNALLLALERAWENFKT